MEEHGFRFYRLSISSLSMEQRIICMSLRRLSVRLILTLFTGSLVVWGADALGSAHLWVRQPQPA